MHLGVKCRPTLAASNKSSIAHQLCTFGGVLQDYNSKTTFIQAAWNNCDRMVVNTFHEMSALLTEAQVGQ